MAQYYQASKKSHKQLTPASSYCINWMRCPILRMKKFLSSLALPCTESIRFSSPLPANSPWPPLLLAALLPMKVLFSVLRVEVLWRRAFFGADEEVEVVLEEALWREILGVLGTLRTLPDLEPRCGAA